MAEKRKMTGRESLSTVHPETRKKRRAAAKKKAASGRKAGVGERDMEEGGAKFRGPAAARSRARNPAKITPRPRPTVGQRGGIDEPESGGAQSRRQRRPGIGEPESGGARSKRTTKPVAKKGSTKKGTGARFDPDVKKEKKFDAGGPKWMGLRGRAR